VGCGPELDRKHGVRMADRLKGRNAVVTGAGRGIGRAIALALAAEGANIVVCDLGVAKDGTGAEQAPADEVAQECRKLGVKAVPHYGDVADFNVAGDIVNTCVAEFGSIDILCNIAGVGAGRMIFNMSEEEWDRVIAVHLKGTFNLCRHACVLMRQQGYGRILNCTSDERVGATGQASYVAAKGAIASLTYAIAWEMGRYGVTCNAIAPAARTRFLLDPTLMEGFKKRVEAGLWTQEQYDQAANLAPAEHMAAIAAYLCSDQAAHINGCVFGAAGHKLSYWSPPAETVTFARDWDRQGPWTWEEVGRCLPALLKGYVNPAPSRAEG
jgi:NAD(P)-dependent dehydrogenase (short-subunit alcohol dehydrogenase family)